MRIVKNLRADQEVIKRYLAALGGGSVVLSMNKHARPSFFIFAHSFITEYIEAGFFKKEELLIKALEAGGFPPDEGPIGLMRADQQKSRAAAEQLTTAAKQWQGGNEEARGEVSWAASEYASILRQHLERLKNLIIPLLEQNLSTEDEQKIAEGLNTLVFEDALKNDPNKYIKQIETLEEELADWR